MHGCFHQFKENCFVAGNNGSGLRHPADSSLKIRGFSGRDAVCNQKNLVTQMQKIKYGLFYANMRFYSADDYLFFVGILKRLSDNLISETAECPFLQPGICPGCLKKRGGRHSQSFRVLLGDQNGNV